MLLIVLLSWKSIALIQMNGKNKGDEFFFSPRGPQQYTNIAGLVVIVYIPDYYFIQGKDGKRRGNSEYVVQGKISRLQGYVMLGMRITWNWIDTSRQDTNTASHRLVFVELQHLTATGSTCLHVLFCPCLLFAVKQSSLYLDVSSRNIDRERMKMVVSCCVRDQVVFNPQKLSCLNLNFFIRSFLFGMLFNFLWKSVDKGFDTV